MEVGIIGESTYSKTIYYIRGYLCVILLLRFPACNGKQEKDPKI